MIGVLAEPEEHPVVTESFELFKTPWEFYRADRDYEVLLCSCGHARDSGARLVLSYGADEKPGDRARGHRPRSHHLAPLLSYGGHRFPIYGHGSTFDPSAASELRDEDTQEPAMVAIESGGATRVRIGYDLFHEIRHLLTRGQPPAHAAIPVLELHIALLRDWILRCSIPLVEIPPVPEGHPFLACLTHDMDHVGIRNHKCDHTMFGFLYRATVGSVLEVCRGRKTARQLLANCAAALTLPLVYCGLAKDFWSSFDRYLEIEGDLDSTFFVIPYKNDRGCDAHGNRRAARRATRYDVTDIADDLKKLTVPAARSDCMASTPGGIVPRGRPSGSGSPAPGRLESRRADALALFRRTIARALGGGRLLLRLDRWLQ